MPIGNMERKSLALIDRGSRCLPTRRKGIHTFVCVVSLYVAETPKASIKDQKPPLPIIHFGIVSYGFVGQPLSKQLYNLVPKSSAWDQTGTPGH